MFRVLRMFQKIVEYVPKTVWNTQKWPAVVLSRKPRKSWWVRLHSPQNQNKWMENESKRKLSYWIKVIPERKSIIYSSIKSIIMISREKRAKNNNLKENKKNSFRKGLNLIVTKKSFWDPTSVSNFYLNTNCIEPIYINMEC